MSTPSPSKVRRHVRTRSPQRFSTVRSVVAFVATGAIAMSSRGAALAAVAPGAVPAVAPQPVATLAPVPEPSRVAAPLASPTPATGRRLAAFSISARRVAFYSNRFIVGADGNVRVALGDGTRIVGDTFSMDLRLNRFVIAGHVRLTAGGKETDGAAFAEFFDFDRAYFLPLLSEPDRWTYANGDYATPLLGREIPGDVFYLPDLSGSRTFLTATHATIDPKESVRFSPANFNFGLTYVPFPSYFLDFSRNPNFAQNSLTGADIDGPYDFAGGEHGLATLHLRFDNVDKLFFAYEQHQISANHYVVFSVNPITRPGKAYNALGYDRISPVSAAQVQLQALTFQHGFTQPLSASGYASVQLTEALHQSFVQLTTQNYYQSLLPQPAGSGRFLYYGDPSHQWIPDHPSGATLTWSGFRHKLKRLPISYQVRSSFGVNHNGISTLDSNSGLLGLGGTEYDTQWNHGVGLTLLTEPITLLRDRSGRGRDTYFTGTFDKQRTWYSVPHHIDVTSTSLSITKVISPQRLTAFFSYTNANVADFYGAQQSIAYPSFAAVSPATHQSYPGYLAFRGFSDSRSYREALVFTPSPAFNTSLTLRENDDFPVAVPGIAQTVGNVTYFNDYGVPPKQLTLDTRFRINDLLTLDVSRSYYFNFGGYQRWTPSFFVQVVK